MERKYTDKQLRRMFIKSVTEYVVKRVAKKQHVTYSQAKKDFQKSKTYAYLTSGISFPDEGPDYFLDWYQNERKYGRMVSSTQLYFEKVCPEEYREAGIIK